MNHNPVLTVDSVEGGVNCVHVRGWAYDPDDTNASLNIHVYVGGAAGDEGAWGDGNTWADRDSPDVEQVMGVGGRHRFDATIPVPDKSGSQAISVYAINIGEGTTTGSGPHWANIAADAEPPTISNVQVSNLTPDGYDVTCDVSDNVGVQYVRFYTWTSHVTNNDARDDMRMVEQSHGNGRYTCHVSRHDHNGEQGVLYYTHIYVSDQVPSHEVGNGAASNIPVPHAMVNYGGNTYLRMDADASDLTSWVDAQRRCEGAYFAGHLATVTSAGEQAVLDELVGSAPTSMVHWWIGASDADAEGAWKWVTGEELSYSHWRESEPNGGMGENYAGVRSDGGYWDDLNGNAHPSTGYIMEIDRFHNLYGEVATDVEEGIYTINSFDHPEFAVDVTGMSDAAHANVELWEDNGTDAQRFRFTKNYVETADGRVHDGSYTITNVHSGMALDVANASLASGANVQQYPVNGTNAQKWYVERGENGCVYLRSKVCDFYLDVYGEYFESGTNMQTWFANGSAAQRFKLSPSADPKAVSSRVYDITPDGYKVEVVLDAPRGIKCVEFPTWTNGNHEYKDDEKWLQGTVDGNVATIEVRTSDYGNRHGLYWTHVYVTDDYGHRSWVDAEKNEVVVPERVASVGGKTYYLVPASMAWDDAGRACEKFGGLVGHDAHLATIRSEEEQRTVAGLVSGGERVEYWIGANDAESEGTWLWVDGSGLDGYSSWAEGEPNGGTEENYAVMYKSTGLWNDEYANAYSTKGVGFVMEVEGDDRCSPMISDVRVIDWDDTGYTVTCRVSDPSGVAKVEFPTWVPERGETGDDALWKSGDLYEDPETGDTIAEFRVSTSDHDDARGRYETHIYATDKAGNKTPVYKASNKAGKVENVIVPDAVYGSQDALYYRFDRAGSWTDARACVEAMPVEGVQLASVSNEGDSDAVASLLAGAGKSAYWLGLSDAEGDGTFQWEGGDAPKYNHWASGQPGTYTGARYGAVLTSNGKWYGYADAGANGRSDIMGFVAMVGYSEEESPCPEGHTWGAWNTTVEPTCKKAGYRERTCSVCGEFEVEQVAALGHDPMEAKRENEVAATCEADGSYESVVVCSRCGEEVSRETKQVAKLGHAAADPVEENRHEPSCTAAGSYDSVTYCSRCGKELGRETKPIPKADHTPGVPVEENRHEPTCTAAGRYDSVTYCQVCGGEASRETVEIPKAEHAWDEGTVTTKPTCTEPGVRTFTCASCNEKRTEGIEAAGHKPGKPVTENESASNTCTEGGTYDEVVYCDVCHAELSRAQKTQPAGQHVPVTDAAVAPTCTKAGLTEGSHCQVCGTVLVAQQPVAALEHDEEHVDAVAPTCTEPGATAGKRCRRCEMVLEGCEPIAALGHDYRETVVAPTCTQAGYTEHKCSRCPDSYVTDRVPAKAHVAGTPQVDSETPAGCETQGSKVLVTRCKDCNKELYRTTEVTPATGHKAGQPSVESDTPASCETAGRKVLVTRCTSCERELSRTVEISPATGHKAGQPAVESQTPATCEAAGSRTTVTRCTACEKELSRSTEAIPARGHSWGEGVVTKSATCTEQGERTLTCTSCGAKRIERIPSGSHRAGQVARENEIPATCSASGHYESVAHCADCGTELSRQTVVTPPAEHEWGAWEVVREATTDRAGLEIRTCKNCKMSTTRDIPQLPRQDIAKASVSVADQVYSGRALEPAVTVRLGTYTLRHGIDYELAYGSNTNAGTARVVIVGKGNYQGSITKTFRIIPMNVSALSISGLGEQTRTGGALTPKPTVKRGATVLREGTDYALSYRNNVNAGTATVTVTGRGNYAGSRTATFRIVEPPAPAPAPAPEPTPHVSYRTHVQRIGWQGYVSDGDMSGTSGRSFRLEGINIKLSDLPCSGGIQYRTHVQRIGWQGWRKDGKMAGTSGKSYRLEAIEIKLYGELAERYDVYYRVHCQRFGWMGWAKNGQRSGSAGYSRRLEGIQIVLVRRGDPAPDANLKGIRQNVWRAFAQKGKKK